MCGLVGLFDARGRRPFDAALLARMNARIAHRGPDGDGFHLAPGIGLGHRRLAIIDLAGGAQPLFNEDGSVAVVFNGEIYNYRPLMAELSALGHRFRTRSDTEVIVHAWEEWGPACVERFRGMFAFALYDANRETLFLARDRLGKKPMYYTALADGTVAFGSELKALLQHPATPRALDAAAIEEFFAYGYVPDPRTIYQGVHKLPPAHRLLWRRGAGQPTVDAYWDLAFDDGAGADEAALGEELRARLRDAVEARLMSEVPLGAFLSGGVDSSAVVAVMAGLSAEPVNTCSIAFAHRDYDESRYAARVAQRYGTRHHVESVDPDAFDLVDRLADMFDEPFADSSAIPTYRVCALARQRVTVALSGDGGDEVFGGYRRYRLFCNEERVRGMVPEALRAPVFGTLGALYPKLDWAPRVLRAKSTFQSLARSAADGYFHAVAVLTDGVRRGLYAPALRRDLQGYHAAEVLRRAFAAAPSDDALARIQYADFKTWLPGDILTKVDRTSMATSLEVRVPLLDHPFVEWAATLPRAMKLRGAEGKYLFKKAVEPMVDADILYRPKMGFRVPLAAWFRGPLRERVRAAVTSPVMADSGLFERDCLTRLVEQHQSGRFDHAPVLWSLLMFESFLRQMHGTTGAAAAAPLAASA